MLTALVPISELSRVRRTEETLLDRNASHERAKQEQQSPLPARLQFEGAAAIVTIGKEARILFRQADGAQRARENESRRAAASERVVAAEVKREAPETSSEAEPRRAEAEGLIQVPLPLLKDKREGGQDRRGHRRDGAPAAETASEVATIAEQELSTAEQQRLEQLREQDEQVRAQETAHRIAAGAYAGAVRIKYEMGPDGRRYAVGGSVPVDVSAVRGDPEATISKMSTIRRAASAAGEATPADRAIASKAGMIAQQALAEIARERYEQAQRIMEEHRVDSKRSLPPEYAEAQPQPLARPEPPDETIADQLGFYPQPAATVVLNQLG